MKSFLSYIAEERLNKQDEELFFLFKSMSKQIGALNDEILKTIECTANGIISKFCRLCKLDGDKFVKENPKISKKIVDLLTPSKGSKFLPMVVLYYQTTDTYMLALVAIKGSIFGNIFGMTGGLIGKVFSKLTGNDTTAVLMPIKPITEDNKIQIDNSAAGIGLLAMTLLLSDIDCEVVWPIKFGDGAFSKFVIKTLDFICPSLMDLLSVCTFGGTSVASRVAKLSKYGAKIGTKTLKVASKSGSKAATKVLNKKMAKTGLKATAKSKKLLAKVPKPVRKFLTKNKNKLKAANKTSRTMKSDIRKLMKAKLTYEDVKNEILSMSTDDLFAFSRHAIVLLAKTYLPKDKRQKLSDVMSKVPDSVIDSVSRSAKAYVNAKRDGDFSTTLADVIGAAVPDDVKYLILQMCA